MNQATKDAIADVREKLVAKYPGFWELADPERRLLAMAYLVDVVQVREEGGNNRGKWVEIFLDSVGLGAGYAWCAAMLAFASIVAKAPYPLRSEGYNPAAVVSWRKWAREKGFAVAAPSRGAIVMHKSTATTGHIGVCVSVDGERHPGGARVVKSLEGNTSPGAGGSQRDGGGAYRRARGLEYWSWGNAIA